MPGWSLGPDLPRTQSNDADGARKTNPSRKRKRANKDINSENVADLWEQHIERRQPAVQVDNRAGGKAKSNDDGKKPRRSENEAKIAPAASEDEVRKSRKTRKPSSKGGLGGSTGKMTAVKDDGQKRASIEAAVSDAPLSKLTPLQSAMRLKLLGARFRHLNESLYTTPSAEASNLFAINPTFFEEYQTGFRQQVSTWPENPVDQFVRQIKQRSKVKPPKKANRFNRKQQKEQEEPSIPSEPERLALPRTGGVCRVADIGCGDARLAKEVKNLSDKARVEVSSFDLFSSEPIVIKADAAHLPVPSDSMDVGVLCLALMGTNWIDFIEEAWRVLHWKGELWIAEIKSRFGRSKPKVVDHSVGKKRKTGKAEAQKQQRQDDENATEKLIAEVDGSNARDESTDVSAFVTILKKRGFVLQHDQAVDLTNKMFVKMKFVKALSPMKGKHADQSADHSKSKAWRELLRESDGDDVDEAAALKPCLYKSR